MATEDLAIQRKKLNYAKTVFFLNTLLGLIGLVISGIAMYFLFRFCVAVIVLDESAKRVLLGESLYKVANGMRSDQSADPIILMMSVYLAFRLVQFFFSTANFESNTEMVYSNLKEASRKLNMAEK